MPIEQSVNDYSKKHELELEMDQIQGLPQQSDGYRPRKTNSSAPVTVIPVRFTDSKKGPINLR